MDFDPGLANILCTRFGAVMYHLRFGIYTSINAKPTHTYQVWYRFGSLGRFGIYTYRKYVTIF